MDDAGSEVLSEPSSDRTVRPTQHPQPISARESESFPEVNAKTEKKVASEANTAVTPPANTSDDVSQISIEIAAVTILNRARILLLLKNRPGAGQCFEEAVKCSMISHDKDLQRKCRGWLEQFQEGLGVCDPLIAREAIERDFGIGHNSQPNTTSSDRPGAPRLSFLLDLETEFRAEVPHSVYSQSVGARQHVPAPAPAARQSPHPPGVNRDGNFTPASALLPPTEVDVQFASVRDAPARQRQPPERPPQSLVQTTPTVVVRTEVVRSSEYRTPFHVLKNMQASPLLKRRRNDLGSPQAHASMSTLTHQRERSAPGGENVVMVGPLPQTGRLLDFNQSIPFEVGEAASQLSTDTPSLTKLAETISANPSPQSDSSVATAVHRRPSILHSHHPPSLAIQTSGSYVASAPDSTVPHNHSPLREAFVPDPDLVDDAASNASAKVQPSTELSSSSKILEELTNKPYDHDSNEFYAHQVHDDNFTNSKPIPSDDIRSLVSQVYRNSNATVPERGRCESAEVKPASNKSSIDTMSSDEQHLGRDSDAIVISRIKQKIAKLKPGKQKQSDASGKPEERTNGPDWHHQSGSADSNSSAANVSTTMDIDSVASDKIPTDEANESTPKGDSEVCDPGHAQIEALLAENVKHKILGPTEKYFTMNPDETMTEQDRLDAERVINVILHEAILSITPDIVMDEYLKYQSKKDGAAEGRSRLGSADSTDQGNLDIWSKGSQSGLCETIAKETPEDDVD